MDQRALENRLPRPKDRPMRDSLIERLAAACMEFAAPPGVDVVVPEPYIPYVPPDWNGTLVVSEAQNLAGGTSYVQRILAAAPAERVQRLYWEGSTDLGIAPWDDGTLKLAVAATWPLLSPDGFAVSNAVLWSQTSGARNINPEEALCAGQSRSGIR